MNTWLTIWNNFRLHDNFPVCCGSAGIANHLCGQGCDQFTNEGNGTCTHGCSVPGAQPNPDMRSEDSYRNEETQQAQQNAAANAAATAEIVIQQAIAAGVEANIAKQVLETQIGVANAAAALKAVEQLNAAAAAAIASGTVLTGCKTNGCCLVGNCGSGQYCAGADAGRNQYGQCVEGKNEPRGGTTIAAAFIAAGGDADAVTSIRKHFLAKRITTRCREKMENRDIFGKYFKWYQGCGKHCGGNNSSR